MRRVGTRRIHESRDSDATVALRVALIVALSFSQRAASRYAVLLVYDLDKSSPERLSLTRDAAERAIALGGGAAD